MSSSILQSFTLHRFLVRYYPPMIILEYENAESISSETERYIYRTMQIVNDPRIVDPDNENHSSSEALDDLAESILDKIPAIKIFLNNQDEKENSTKTETKTQQQTIRKPSSASGTKAQANSSTTTATKFQLTSHQRKCFKPQILQIISLLRQKFSALASSSSTTSSNCIHQQDGDDFDPRSKFSSTSQFCLFKNLQAPPPLHPITNLALNKSGDRCAVSGYDRCVRIYGIHLIWKIVDWKIDSLSDLSSSLLLLNKKKR